MTYYHGAGSNAPVQGATKKPAQAKSYQTGTDLAKKGSELTAKMRAAPGSAARARSALEQLALAAMPAIRNRAAMLARPRLNPTLLALHMHAARNPQPYIIDTRNDF